MSLSLLTLVEAGKPKANSIVAQIHDTRNADSGTKDRVYTQVLHAVRNLSTTLWPLDKMAQRIELLDELSKQVTSTHKGMPLMETSVERRERAWRADFDKEGGAMVGLGYERDGAGQVRAEQVLRRRGRDMARLGAWLPALFVDGSWYLLRRLPNASLDGATPLLSRDELAAAEELLQ